MRISGTPPSHNEYDAYCQRLESITAGGGQLSLIQLYTVARTPAESFVAPLRDEEVDSIVDLVRRRTGLQVAGFHGIQPAPAEG